VLSLPSGLRGVMVAHLLASQRTRVRSGGNSYTLNRGIFCTCRFG